MYQALYRKYRPVKFDDVVGQEVIVKTLKNAIKNNRISHAYLFTGPRGTGKTSIAKIFAKTINCENLNNLTPCNKCVSCTQINNKETTDIIEIDAASNNGVDEIRELKSKINLVPSNGKYKVYIIDEVHMLTVGAFNALLKTLEEPPSHVLFILATTEPHKIPDTILSRCQRFDFKKISVLQIATRLKYIAENENIQIDNYALEEIARLSDGGLRDAIGLLDQVISYVGNNDIIQVSDIHEINGTVSQEELQNLIENIFIGDLAAVFNQFDLYNESGKNLVKVAEEILLFLRNVLLYKTVPNYFSNRTLNLKPYEKINEKVEQEELVILIDLINENIYKMKNSNNPKILFELMIIKQISSINHIRQKEKLLNQTKPPQIQQEKITRKKEPDLDSFNKISNENKELIEKIKQLRINNTLAEFQRKILLNMKNKYEEFMSYTLDSQYSEYVTLIMDGEIKAASEKYAVIVFEKKWLSEKFNAELEPIETLFELVYKKHLKVISCDQIEWEQIKTDFNTQKKQYCYQEDNLQIPIQKKQNHKKNDIDEIFGDIIEYEN